RYELSPVHPVTRVAFDWKSAAPDVDEDRLRRAIAERGGALRVGRAAELALAVKDAVRERGYLNAAVTPGVQIAHTPHTTTLIFTIDPGTRTVLGTLNVTGSPGVRAAALLKQRGLLAGGPYGGEALNERIEKSLSGV